MLLYLVRHGDALPDSQDHYRALSPKGRQEADRVAHLARKAGANPRRIWHSTRLRAQQTAEILALQFAPEEVRAITGLSPDDDPTAAAEIAAALDEDLMLVGHLPHVARLTEMLTGQSMAFSTATVVCLERQEHGWRMLWRVTPE